MERQEYWYPNHIKHTWLVAYYSNNITEIGYHMPKDRNLVNFSEEYELNNRLKRNNKRQTEENRQKLKNIGDKAKKQLNKTRLTHEELDNAIERNQDKLD